MWMYLCLTLGCGTVLAVIVLLASKNGSKAAQLEALKAELRKQAEEQQRVARINNSVSNMSNSDVRDRLSNIQSK